MVKGKGGNNMDSTRWFDENGNEIIRKPIDLEEVEPIAEIGGTFEEFSVGLNFYSEKLDKAEITRLIGAEPTKSWNPGESHPIGNSKKTRITDWGKWYLISKRDNTDLNIKLKELLGSLTSDLEKWKLLTSKYDAWIDVAGYMENWNRGFTLQSEVMKMLSDRNLEIIFDIYYDGDKDEDVE
ncbi:DUF4279 domain-containing protein [Echinicola shivajiensis]|uniref:DUF4279 domain-containing protein n=1 Tax=Echinicola shivajiensis TaxID=1035916 RepID=UPI001BFCA4B5|nr:DUF4279 domain-containing protein [Echinicola shivajiensis]